MVHKTEGDTYYQRFTTGVATLNNWRVANGEDEITDPIYDKLLFQMDDEELAKVSAILKLKAPAVSNLNNPAEPMQEPIQANAN
jgi:hypothetical protein